MNIPFRWQKLNGLPICTYILYSLKNIVVDVWMYFYDHIKADELQFPKCVSRIMIQKADEIIPLGSRDKFELEFSGSSEPELWRFRAETSRAGALQFSSWNWADKRSNFLTLIKNVIQIFQFCACTIMITTNSYQFYGHLYKSM